MNRKVRTHDLKRRQVLRGIAAAGCAGALAAVSAIALAPPRGLLSEIGQLLAQPEGRDAGLVALARRIVHGSVQDATTAKQWDARQIAHVIRTNIVRDHAFGRVVTRHGWQISTTEAWTLELMDRLAA